MEDHEPFLREAIALSKSAMQRGDEPLSDQNSLGRQPIHPALPAGDTRWIEEPLPHLAQPGREIR